MMNPFSFLRLLAWVKRGAVAMERSASALESLAHIEEQRWAKDNVRPKGKMTEIQSFDQNEADKRWKEYLKERGIE